MPQASQFRFRKGDLLAVGFVLAAAILLTVFFWLHYSKTKATVAQIYLNGELVHEMPLDADAEYTVSGAYHNTVAVKNGKISVTFTDCPGGDCHKIGWIDSAGRSIVCLPNRMEIVIAGEAPVDAVVGVAQDG